MKQLKLKVSACLLALGMSQSQAADVDALRGALLFNLSKVFTFPASGNESISLCLYPQSSGIIQFFNGKTDLRSQGKPFQLRVLTEQQQPTVDLCQMLYLEWPLQGVSQAQLVDWSSRIISISHDPAFLLDGGLISLTTANNKMVMMMNKNSLEKTKVTFPSRVLKLATWYPQ